MKILIAMFALAATFGGCETSRRADPDEYGDVSCRVPCALDGACWVGQSGSCAPRANEDCAQSQGCKLEGRCWYDERELVCSTGVSE